jgi:hypothetical protein
MASTLYSCGHVASPGPQLLDRLACCSSALLTVVLDMSLLADEDGSSRSKHAKPKVSGMGLFI